MTQNNINAIVDALVKAGASADLIAATVSKLTVKPVNKDTKKSAPKKPELVEFKKADGTIKMVTQAQANAWTKYRDRPHATAEEREAKLADWAKAREGYKASDELIAAIKANRAAITRKIAKEQYGFIGTKDDLKALKAEVCEK